MSFPAPDSLVLTASPRRHFQWGAAGAQTLVRISPKNLSLPLADLCLRGQCQLNLSSSGSAAVLGRPALRRGAGERQLSEKKEVSSSVFQQSPLGTFSHVPNKTQLLTVPLSQDRGSE